MSTTSVPPDPELPAPPDDGHPDTPDAATTPPGGGHPPHRRARRWWRVVAVVALLCGLVAAATTVPLPYYLVQPGSVRPAEQRVDIEGAPSFETDGEVLFTTVLLSQATPVLMVRSWLDDAVETRTEEEMYPEGDRETNQRVNRVRMDLSKLTATRVALELVGIEAEYTADGARVLGVISDGPSDGVIEPDDVIVGVDGDEVAMPDDIAGTLGDREPGDTVRVEVRRDGGEERSEVRVTLGESPTEDGRPVLGVEVEPADPSIDSEVSVTVDSGEVSGPSAGLAWTLAIIDRLTPGSLTEGRRIAVTGEIRDDGTVGPVGGVVQKLSAVKREGLEVFMYPAETSEDEQRELARIAGDDVELWPVEDIDAAVDRLAPDGLELPD